MLNVVLICKVLDVHESATSHTRLRSRAYLEWLNFLAATVMGAIIDPLIWRIYSKPVLHDRVVLRLLSVFVQHANFGRLIISCPHLFDLNY